MPFKSRHVYEKRGYRQFGFCPPVTAVFRSKAREK
jgi:hypothetical protein